MGIIGDRHDTAVILLGRQSRIVGNDAGGPVEVGAGAPRRLGARLGQISAQVRGEGGGSFGGELGKPARRLDVGHPVPDLVDTSQQGIDDVRRAEDLAAAQGRQQVLADMQQPSHVRQVGNGGAAFERVKGAEDDVDAMLVVGRAFEREQLVGGLVDELARLEDELFEQDVHGDRPVRALAWSTRSSWLTGFTR